MKLSDVLKGIGSPIAYYPGLAKRLGSVKATIFFCQIFFYKGKESNPELGVYKTAQEIYEETGLSYDEQKTAREILKKMGVLTETVRRLEHRIYYKVNEDAINDLPEQGNPRPRTGKTAFGKQEKPDSGTGESLVGGEGKPVFDEHGKTAFVYQENTNEITTYTPSSPTRGVQEDFFTPENRDKKPPEDTSQDNDFVEAWNRNCGPLPKVTKATNGRQKKLRIRLKEGLTLEVFTEAVKACSAKPFLRGDSGQWQATFDWLIENDTNISKAIENNYGLQKTIDAKPKHKFLTEDDFK